MKAFLSPTISTTALLISVSVAFAQQTPAPQRPRIDLGKVEYTAKCATCHGVTGRGDGPVAGFTNRTIADLSTLAKNNGGILPVDRMYEIIEGSKEVPSHGPRDMPIWGTVYRVEAAERYMDSPYDPDAYVRARILAIIEYISRIQSK